MNDAEERETGRCRDEEIGNAETGRTGKYLPVDQSPCLEFIFWVITNETFNDGRIGSGFGRDKTLAQR